VAEGTNSVLICWGSYCQPTGDRVTNSPGSHHLHRDGIPREPERADAGLELGGAIGVGVADDLVQTLVHGALGPRLVDAHGVLVKTNVSGQEATINE